MRGIPRYQSLSMTGAVLETGKRLCDVQHAGERIIVDYKLRRFHVQGYYPVNVCDWRNGLSDVARILRGSK